ncbi:MAG: response regulator, partial [Spirochaetaceae bacterium]|nr:response regulator [Spirochaetaceae bacterium]
MVDRGKDSGEATFLIVDDSPTQVQELQYILEKCGHRVQSARNGAEALAMLAKARPTAVISDVVMPVMDGFALCRRIKDDPALGTIPVILLTSLTDPDDVIRGLECGADYYLNKPCHEAILN